MEDVRNHELVPDHTVLDGESIEAVLSEYDVEKTDLPNIKRTDRAIPDDAAVGDVVRIERDSRTTDTAVVYRLVVD